MKFHIETRGCPKNQTDSESCSEILIKAGYEVSETQNEADILLV
ncbi:MAG: hypothetical protein ACRCUS_06725, partial [Anaerovoracaceae bacterium]